MDYMIQITEDSAMDLKEHARKILKHGKELFECIEEICGEGGSMSERGGSYGNRGGGRYGNRGGDGGYGGGSYGNRMNYREEEDDEDYYYGDPYMGERRGVRGTGRYSRYRR